MNGLNTAKMLLLRGNSGAEVRELQLLQRRQTGVGVADGVGDAGQQDGGHLSI